MTDGTGAPPSPPEPPGISPEVKICPGCRTRNAPSSQYCYKCGLKLPDQPTVVATLVRYGGFWRRLVAYLIDGVVASLIAFIITVIITTVVFSAELESYVSGIPLSGETYYQIFRLWSLVGFLVELNYFTIAIGRWGRTVGKLALGLKVVRTNGEALSYWRALGRVGGYYLCGLTWGIGFLVIAFQRQKRGLHDLVCDTVVVKTR